MKRFLTLVFLASVVTLLSCTSYNFESKPASRSIYDIKIKALDGTELDLKKYKGKKLLIVNVASKCGYTPQYEGLQKLYDAHNDKVEILGVPCNQFMGQEPGSADEIATFCKKNYDVTFQMAEKVDVKGKDQHPLYAWLTQKSQNGSQDSKVKWNFQKYLISADGNLEAIFMSGDKPMSAEVLDKIKS